MRRLVIYFMLVMSFNVYAQKDKTKKTEADSTVYYFATLKLSSGLHVLTSIDTLIAEAEKIDQKLLAINELNKPRLLKYAQSELGEPDLTAEIGVQTNVLEVQPTMKLIRSELDRFINIHEGKVYNLLRFKFTKPREKETINVTRYE